MVDGRTGEDLELALTLIDSLSEGIGPRPPGSAAERAAADLIAAELRKLGLEPRSEEFSSARSFGPAQLSIFGLALAGWAVERRSRPLGAALGVAAAVLALAESRFVDRGPLRLLRRRTSRNVWAAIEPPGHAAGTVCLVSHMDSSRSGLMFHPGVTPRLGAAVAAVGVGVIAQAAAPFARRTRAGRKAIAVARALVLAGAVLVGERELRGVDVPGANDNASGVGACVAIAGRLAGEPLSNTRVVVLVTGSEESGVFGMREFLRSHDTTGWTFVNFDGVGADAPLRVLSKEGGPLSGLTPDPELLGMALGVGVERPEIAAEPLAHGSGLPYDSTPVHQRGGRAITVVNQDGPIPDYHWPTDTVDRISRPALGRAIEFGLELARRLDR